VKFMPKFSEVLKTSIHAKVRAWMLRGSSI